MGPLVLKHADYTVGWVCALPKEMTAARAMLDEEHEDLSLPPSDRNTYSLGRIGGHNIAIACLPKGEIGTNSAATVATRMSSTFKFIRFGLMVGIGGGVPSKMHDVRLGDVVVSMPTNQHGGVVQWDFGKATTDCEFERTGALNRPPGVLMTALAKLESTHQMKESKVSTYLSDMVAKHPKLSEFTRHVPMDDILFDADYDHIDTNDTCIGCDRRRIASRSPRDHSDITIHYGLIASGNQVIKHGVKRDEISNSLGGALCFEMEAAGLMNEFPCIVIRGICDYADSHKNKQWQEYAAATAAAFAKELLNTTPASQVENIRTAEEAVAGAVAGVARAGEFTL